jgi:hypothetical protein
MRIELARVNSENTADYLKYLLAGLIHCPSTTVGPPVQYKQFTIDAYEREPGKWRAHVQRTSGRALIAGAKLLVFVTKRDGSSEADAMSMAIEAIDAGAFSRPTKRSSEKFWRRTTGRKNRRQLRSPEETKS